LLPSEKRSLVRFLAIYLLSTLLLFALASWIFYTASKHDIIARQKESLAYEADRIVSQIRALHRSTADTLFYPQSSIVKSAIYDLDGNYIFGTLPQEQTLKNSRKNLMIYYTTAIEPYYLGAAYLLVAAPVQTAPIATLKTYTWWFMAAAAAVFSVLGYVLGRLFTAPMRNSIETMNRFIQDTTHELNTPISTILTNIEMIETFGKHHENSAELQRIAIASETLSRIYDDLTYLNLNHRYHRHILPLDISKLVQERLIYFEAMIHAKGLNVTTHIASHVILEMDKNDAIRLIDNLISNAIKYNRPQGVLRIVLHKEYFSVSDTGSGIAKKDIHTVMQRFKRIENREGGFGIGLDIVLQVVHHYNFDFSIQSQEYHGTEVSIRWQK